MTAVFASAGFAEIEAPFPRLSYAEAMARYGSDKPDLRFGLPLADVTDAWVRHSEFRVAAGVARAGGRFYGLAHPGGAARSRRQITELEERAKAYGAGGLLWLRVGEQGLEGPTAKFLREEGARLLVEATGAAAGDLVLCVGAAERVAQTSMGQVRLALGRESLDEASRTFRFVWVHRFPIFDQDEETGSWKPAHHMFTMPREEDFPLLESDPGRVHGQLYDLVCNGVELGSGSIRIHRRDIQERIMKVIGLEPEEAEEKFGFLLRSFAYGAPPHGGIALGLDRIVMLLVGGESIREVIAFPKTTNASCPMDGSPSRVDERLLRELHIRLEEGGEG